MRVCDKLFVPPTIAAAINAAVHNVSPVWCRKVLTDPVTQKQFENAAQFLEELWECKLYVAPHGDVKLMFSAFQLSSEPPRVIITLAKHRNEVSETLRIEVTNLTG